MLSMKRIWCWWVCITSDVVRVPSPKNRTPCINVPSVTPVAAKMIRSPDARSFERYTLLKSRNPHRAAPLLVLRLVDDETRIDLTVETPHRRGGQHTFGRASDPHHRVHAASHDRRRDAGRKVAVANQPDARARRANLVDELLRGADDPAR